LTSANAFNGELVEVVGRKNDGGLLLKDGRELPPHFNQFTYGYANTSHSAQGKTVDHGILVMGEHPPMRIWGVRAEPSSWNRTGQAGAVTACWRGPGCGVQAQPEKSYGITTSTEGERVPLLA
jgi:hypothetical protein